MSFLKNSLSFFLFFISFTLFSYATTPTIPNIVSVSWLKSHYNNPHLIIIDTRKEEVFAKGHLKNAINMPVFRDLFDKELMLPSLGFLKTLFSNAGIDNKSLVVAYGNNDMIWAARLYWVVEVLGHNAVGLLDVGYGNWKKDALPLSTEVFHPQKKEFVPNINNNIIETSLSTLVSLGKASILDGRPHAFYRGEKSHAKRFGHIATALNYPGYQNYEKTSTGSKLKSLESLKELYKDLPKDKKIILYCEDGADAALNYIMLKQLGYKKASIYEASWLEWGNDFNLPIEKGTPKE